MLGDWKAQKKPRQLAGAFSRKKQFLFHVYNSLEVRIVVIFDELSV